MRSGRADRLVPRVVARRRRPEQDVRCAAEAVRDQPVRPYGRAGRLRAIRLRQPALPTRTEGNLWTAGVTTVTDVLQTSSVVSKLFRSEQGGHEQVVFCQDRSSGLKAVIALHSTALGPALGGTRFYDYATDEEAALDALNL